MSQPENTPDPDDNTPDPVEDTTGADALGDAGKKALDAMKAQRNAAQTELKKAQAALKEIEDRGKSEAEKVAERLAVAEKTAAEATAKALRLEVAAAKGLTAKQAARLVGATREELEADADELLADFPATPATPTKATPKPDPSQGPKHPAPKRAGSLSEAVAAAIASSKAAGG